MEAEVRDILESAMRPEGRLRLDSALADVGRKANLTEAESAVFDAIRDPSPRRSIGFE